MISLQPTAIPLPTIQPSSNSPSTPHKSQLLDDSALRHSQCSHSHNRRTPYQTLLKRIAFISTLVFLAICLFWEFIPFGDELGMLREGGLFKRQNGEGTGTGTGTGNGDSVFVKNKYYLIVVFVGLLLVVIAAIFCAAWCCRGAFNNPICCPCYCCACIGCLGCLEAIGCGLCCEGLADIGVN